MLIDNIVGRQTPNDIRCNDEHQPQNADIIDLPYSEQDVWNDVDRRNDVNRRDKRDGPFHQRRNPRIAVEPKRESKLIPRPEIAIGGLVTMSRLKWIVHSDILRQRTSQRKYRASLSNPEPKVPIGETGWSLAF